MGLRIKTNMMSEMAQHNLEKNSEELQNSLEKLSSGMRINKASDDPAGLAISDKMRTKMRGLAQVKRNVADGISLLQTGEGGLNEMSNIVIRMRELTSQAASDTIGAKERSYLNKEFVELGKEIIRIRDQTEFNGNNILADNKNEALKISLGSTFLSEKGNADNNNIDLTIEGMPTLYRSLSKLSELNIAGDTAREVGGDGAGEIFKTIDASTSQIIGMRASMGALQSRLNYTIESIDSAHENLTAAQSRIRDVDYAEESSKLAQNRIMVAAGTSILSQANQFPEHVLMLLKQ